MISKRNLFDAAEASGNPQLLSKVERWYELATRNDFDSFSQLQASFPSADMVGDKVVFNLGAYRLICGVSFLRRTLFFKALLTHASYDRGGWKS